ncbi:hypothetical protein ABPG72_018313 [Tetrahymena utriculariae]
MRQTHSLAFLFCLIQISFNSLQFPIYFYQTLFVYFSVSICNHFFLPYNTVEKDEVIENINKDIRKKNNSDKACFNILNGNLNQNLNSNDAEFKREVESAINSQRTASVGRKRIMQRQDVNSNSNQLFKMLSTQKSQEVKSIESQRHKIQDKIHQRNNNTFNNQQNENSLNGGTSKQTNQTLSSILKNSFLKYPHQIAPQNQHQDCFCQDDQIKVNSINNNNNNNNNNNTANTPSNEHADQVYQYYTGFESENSSNQCPPIINKNSHNKNQFYDQKNTGKNSYQDSGSAYNEFLPDYNSGNNQNGNKINAIQKQEANSSSTASSRNDTDNQYQQFCTSLPSQRYHQHKFIASVERNHQNKIHQESTPPKEIKYYDLNSCSRSKIQSNKKSWNIRSTSQNYHLYNPNTNANKKLGTNAVENNNQSFGTVAPTVTASPTAQALNTAGGVFFSSKLYQNNQIITQTIPAMQESIEYNQNKINHAKINSAALTTNNETITNYQSSHNEPSCERTYHHEKGNQKSVVMKIGKKMIKILNPYKNIVESKNNYSVESNNKIYKKENAESMMNCQNNCFTSTQITPKKSIIANLDYIEETQKVQDEIMIMNQDQDNQTIPTTPSKLKQNPFCQHYNQNQYQQYDLEKKDKIRDINKKLEILNMNIKKRQMNNFNSEKTTDSSSKENEINTKTAYQTDSNEENTQEDEDHLRVKKQAKIINQIQNSDNIFPSTKCTVNKKYLIVKQNKLINQCFQSPFLKPTTVSKKRIQNEQPQHICKLNDIITIMSESQDSFNLDDQMSVIGGNCNNPSLASTIKSIVQEMAV